MVADALSRPPPTSVSSVNFPQVPSVDLKAMARVQDPAELLKSTSLELRKVKFNDTELWCDMRNGEL